MADDNAHVNNKPKTVIKVGIKDKTRLESNLVQAVAESKKSSTSKKLTVSKRRLSISKNSIKNRLKN